MREENKKRSYTREKKESSFSGTKKANQKPKDTGIVQLFFILFDEQHIILSRSACSNNNNDDDEYFAILPSKTTLCA